MLQIEGKNELNKFFSNRINLNITRAVCYILIMYLMNIQNVNLSVGIAIISLMFITNVITHIHAMAMGILYMLMKEMKVNRKRKKV